MILMAKMIKFDLPIDRVKVATLDQLRDHFTTEIIAHFRSGLLARWLQSRNMTYELASVEALAAGDDPTVLKRIVPDFRGRSRRRRHYSGHLGGNGRSKDKSSPVTLPFTRIHAMGCQGDILSISKNHPIGSISLFYGGISAFGISHKTRVDITSF